MGRGRLVDLDLAAETGADQVYELMGFGVQPERVDGGESQVQPLRCRHVDHGDTGHLEAGVDHRPARERLACPGEDPLGCQRGEVDLVEIAVEPAVVALELLFRKAGGWLCGHSSRGDC